MVQYSNFEKIMDVKTISKNGASSKSHTSRSKLIKNKLIIGGMCIFLPLFAMNTFGQTASKEHTKLEILDCPQSFAELLKKFEGRVVYIDFMGSHCKPCIEELKEVKKLESYFEENNIVKLFITIDKRETVENALKIIQNDYLSGYFVSIHPKNELDSIGFQHDLNDLFFTYEVYGIVISIPRYAIVNSKGELVVKNAVSPSNPIALKKQLEKYLK